MRVEDKVDEVVKHLYTSLASSSGVLLGLKPDQRPIVEAIVRTTILFLERRRDEIHL